MNPAVQTYNGRYGCRGGATNGLVSTARLFFVRHLSNLSSAARLWSRGMCIVAPAPSTASALAARRPALNLVSVTATETEFRSYGDSVVHAAGAAFMAKGTGLHRLYL